MDPYVSLARGQYSQYDVTSEVQRQEGYGGYGSVDQIQAANAYYPGEQRQDYLPLEASHRAAAMTAHAAPSMNPNHGMDYMPLNEQQGAMPPPPGYSPHAGHTMDVNSQIAAQGMYTPFDQSQVLSQQELNRLYQGASDVQIQDKVLLHERVVDKHEQKISKVVSGKRQILTIERVVEVPQVIVKETERRVPKPEIIERIIEVPGKVEYRYGRDGANGFGGQAAQLRAAIEEAQRTGKSLQQVCQERFGSTEMLSQMQALGGANISGDQAAQMLAAVEEAQRTGKSLQQVCQERFGSTEMLSLMQAMAAGSGSGMGGGFGMGGGGFGMGGGGFGMGGGDDDIIFDYGGYGAQRPGGRGGNMHLVGPGLAAAEAAIAAYRQGGDIDALLGCPAGVEPGSEEYNNWLQEMEANGQIEIREEIIEVPQIVTEERLVHVPGRKEIQERLIEVPKVEWVERVEYDDYVEYREVPVDKIIEVPEIEYVIKEVDVPVPQKYIQEYTVEKYKEVPVTQVQEVERIEHVPVMVPDGWRPPNLASLGMGSGGAASQSFGAGFSSQALGIDQGGRQQAAAIQSMSSMAPVGTSMPGAAAIQSMRSMAPVGTSMPGATMEHSFGSAPPSGLLANFSQLTGSIGPGGFGAAGSSVGGVGITQSMGSMAPSPGFTVPATGTVLASTAVPAASVQASQQAAADALFDRIDKDHSGTISRAEMEQALASMRSQSMAVAPAPQSHTMPVGTTYCGGGVATPPQSMPPAAATMIGGQGSPFASMPGMRTSVAGQSAAGVNPFSSMPSMQAQPGFTGPGTIMSSSVPPVSGQAGTFVGQPMGSVTNAYMSYDPSRVGATGSALIGQAPGPPQSLPCGTTCAQGSGVPQSLPAGAMASGMGQANPFASMPSMRTSMAGQQASGVNPFGSMPPRVGASVAGGDLFSQIDTDGSGTISRAEFEKALGSMRSQRMVPQTMVVS
eukprot:TRINITY_DN2874_c0_g1_i2.p1 TRINITY_DN2874_c0_g1~~TRINITY_DN2874_c0_g1_i2.p1  ORF type:complete len:960 (+),score=215.67 TRINITY_DN2874_c0_g1_i2:118-2997(+)